MNTVLMIFFGAAVVSIVYYSLLIKKLWEIKIAYPCVVSKHLFLANILILVYAVICGIVFFVMLLIY